ncbi:hypothetical protein PAXRUDRAFT_832783 [Paxillus rubicundulus Ve08.2h10]|uniref:Uncharacterized protein n=1 Tax=Paxillus rubicundulus Ve08.2h10 TaxID=930991 RepID=A0A0D0DQD2_9AGAM|nr:hypothetical protein PAXRUDRAFT_832783 [Paxillus rubicundulus Ve08.2h10]
MPPQPGMFALPYASTHKARPDVIQPDNMSMTISYQHQPHIQAQAQLQGSNPHIHHAHNGLVAGPSTRIHDDPKRDKKRKDISGKVGKEMSDRRDEGRHFAENISALHSSAIQLASRPETHPLYNVRMYPLSLERSAILAQVAYEEKHNLAAIETAYKEERERVEDEWRRGRVRVRERLLEGIEERRRRAREEKEGEGALNGTFIHHPPDLRSAKDDTQFPQTFPSTLRRAPISRANYATKSVLVLLHLRHRLAQVGLPLPTEARPLSPPGLSPTPTRFQSTRYHLRSHSH